MKLHRKTLNTISKTVQVLDDLGNAVESVDESQRDVGESETRDIPQKRAFGIDLKQIPEYREMRQQYKTENEKAIFMRDIQSILDHLPPDAHQYSAEILLMILNVSEQFYVYGDSAKRSALKLETVKELMLPYFADDEKLLDSVLALVKHRVRRSTPLTRTLRRLRNFFC